MPFVTTYHPGVKNIKQTLIREWRLIQNQPLPTTIYETPPFISHKSGKSPKDMRVGANSEGMH